MISLFHYLIQWPSAIANLLITIVALATLAGALLFARKTKNEPDQVEPPTGAWPPGPTGLKS